MWAWVWVCGCYHPSPATGSPCGAGDVCPDHQVCDTSQAPPLCVTALAGGPDAATSSDGPITDPDATSAIDAAPLACGGGCPASLPVCDSGTNDCRGCVQDSECASDVCNELQGTCVAEANALYVAAGAGPTACTRAAPCGTVSHAVTFLSATLNTIKVGAGTYSDSWVMPAVTTPFLISGPSNVATDVTINFSMAGGNDHVVELHASSVLVLEGMTVQGSTSECVRAQNGTLTLRHVLAQSCAGGLDLATSTSKVFESQIVGTTGFGIAQAGGTLLVERTLVAGNGDDGLHVSGGKFTIANSMIVANPGGDGVHIVTTDAASSLDFVTIASNGGTAGVHNTSGTAVSVRDSIIANNAAQLSGAVTAAYCLTSDNVVAGTGNIAGAAAFVNPGVDFHIQASSPARSAADPASTVNIDFDGDHRPAGAGRDIGADEIP